MNQVSGTHHIAIICSDIERAREFYVDVLGFRVVNETFRAERQSYKLDLSVGDGTMLELFTFPSSPPRPSFPEACGLRHLAFSVRDIDDAVSSLQERGIQVENIRVDEYTGCRFTFFSDPDGLPLELYELSPRSATNAMQPDMKLSDFIEGFGFAELDNLIDRSRTPWEVVAQISSLVNSLTNGDPFVHPSATVEPGAVLKGPLYISEGCFIASNAYLRGGVYLGKNVSIGPGVEVKSSLVLSHTSLAHFNFIGDSILGHGVNLEAGAHLANHWNERTDKSISVASAKGPISTGLTKFGAIVGDRCRIGANAVLSPGSLLKPNTIINRLELVDQLGSNKKYQITPSHALTS